MRIGRNFTADEAWEREGAEIFWYGAGPISSVLSSKRRHEYSGQYHCIVLYSDTAGHNASFTAVTAPYFIFLRP